MNKKQEDKTRKAYKAMADIAYYMELKAQALADMKTAEQRNDLRWYQQRKSAAEACDRAIKKAKRSLQGAMPAMNKAGNPNMKHMNGGRILCAN